MNEEEKQADTQHIQALVEHLSALHSMETMERCLRDLLTPAELLEISHRLQIFHMLDAGQPQRKIAEKLGVAIATVTRGSKAYKKSKQI